MTAQTVPTTDDSGSTQDRPRLAAAVVLAAGEGTRMRSTTPKMLHTIGGRSLLGHVLTATRELDARRTAVVVRHQAELVAEHARTVSEGVLVVEQD